MISHAIILFQHFLISFDFIEYLAFSLIGCGFLFLIRLLAPKRI